MSEVVRIALVGDQDPAVTAHRAIPEALGLSARRLGLRIEPTWVPTVALGAPVEARLSPFAAVWCVPASPYANTEGALAAIRFCRESAGPSSELAAGSSTPCWSTCGTPSGTGTHPTPSRTPQRRCR
jgi:CTP synthase (UTP-ammonia lyase)